MMDSGDSEGGARGPSLKTAARCSCCCGGFVWIKCCGRNEWWSLTLRLDCELEKVSTIIIIGNLLGSILDEDDKTLFLFFRFCFYLFACFVFGRTRRLFFGLLPRFCLFFPLRSFPMHERCQVVTEAAQNTDATVVVVQKYSRTKRSLDYVRRIGRRRRSRRITTRYLCVCWRLVNFDILRNRWRLQKSSVGKFCTKSQIWAEAVWSPVTRHCWSEFLLSALDKHCSCNLSFFSLSLWTLALWWLCFRFLIFAAQCMQTEASKHQG